MCFWQFHQIDLQHWLKSDSISQNNHYLENHDWPIKELLRDSIYTDLKEELTNSVSVLHKTVYHEVQGPSKSWWDDIDGQNQKWNNSEPIIWKHRLLGFLPKMILRIQNSSTCLWCMGWLFSINFMINKRHSRSMPVRSLC